VRKLLLKCQEGGEGAGIITFEIISAPATNKN